MIIHAACPFLVPLRIPGNQVGAIDSPLDPTKGLHRTNEMVLPFVNRLDDVLLPPPFLYTDPFSLDDILDVSVKKKRERQKINERAAFKRTMINRRVFFPFDNVKIRFFYSILLDTG